MRADDTSMGASSEDPLEKDWPERVRRWAVDLVVIRTKGY